MSSEITLLDANRLVTDRPEIADAFSHADMLLLLHLVRQLRKANLEQIANAIPFSRDRIAASLERLTDARLVVQHDGEYSLSEAAQRRLEYGTESLEFLVGATLSPQTELPHPLHFEYKIKELIGSGATSFTFLAEQSDTHARRTLKVFLPRTVTYEQVDAALAKRSDLVHEQLPEVTDVGNARLVLPDGRSYVLPCVAFTYVFGAMTFAKFLKSGVNLNPAVYEQFIDRVGSALAAIEAAGLQHGDLHENNILVVAGDQPSRVKQFWVIDFIGVPSGASPELLVRKDLENFRDHLLNATLVGCQAYPGLPASQVLGHRAFRVLNRLRQGEYNSFKQLLEDFHRPSTLPSHHFVTPQLDDPFKWLRVEAFSDPKLLFELFVPVPSRFETIARFGNTWISGPRGCGKSHYIRVLEFNAKVISEARTDSRLRNKLESLKYDFRSVFGILFPCRLGEFRSFEPEALGKAEFDYDTKRFLKHILVLKIWNKTLCTIESGLKTLYAKTSEPILQPPLQVDSFCQFLEQRLGQLALIGREDPMSLLSQCIKVCVARENSAIAVWNRPQSRGDSHLLNEADLDEFFAVMRATFPDLARTQFFVLVDDASAGAISFEMQKVLNSLVRAVQSNHCFKITFDKFMYTQETSDGRATDPRHEVTYVDLGEIASPAQKQSRADADTSVDLSSYMAEVVNLRLEAAGYKHRVFEILGDSQPAKEFLAALSRPGSIRGQSKGRRMHGKAYYAGWNIVLSLAHGSVRTLLELIEHIFRTAGANHEAPNIPLALQDAAVRSYSRRQFSVIAMVPDDIDERPAGPLLQSVISSFGRISREYLQRYDTGEPSRWYETITIERLDSLSLDPKAEKILKNLITYGLFLDEGVTFSRAQLGLIKRYDMNKIFAPAFRTTYRVRNHLYLSKSRLEQLLLDPAAFLRQHRTKLERLTVPIAQKSLFS
jgi:hypothetical protein